MFGQMDPSALAERAVAQNKDRALSFAQRKSRRDRTTFNLQRCRCRQAEVDFLGVDDRAMFDERGEAIESAGPSMPAVVLGLVPLGTV